MPARGHLDCEDIIGTSVEIQARNGEKRGSSFSLRVPRGQECPRLTCVFLLVVLVFVDTLADAVLLAIDTTLLALCQMTVVLCHVSLFTVLDAGFALFEVGSLLRSQCAILNAVADALLLIFFALVDFIDARMARINNARTSAGSSCG